MNGTMAEAAKAADLRLKNKSCYIIDPASTSMHVWGCVTALTLIFTAIVTPFEVGFLPSAETPLDALFLINRLIDGIFVVDMVISSLLMYRRRRRTQTLMWEFRHSHVLYNYLTGWFLLDLLSVAPCAFDIYELATVTSGSSVKAVKLLRLIRTLRLMRLLRLMHVARMMKSWATRNSLPYSTIPMFKLLLMVLYVTYLFACFLGIMATISKPNAKLDSWQGYFGWCGEGAAPVATRRIGYWARELVTYDLYDGSGTFTCVGPFEMWLACLTWGIAIIVASGEEPPSGPFPGNERADPMAFLSGETLFLSLLGLGMAALRAYVIAKFVDAISNSDPDATLWKNQFNDLNRFCAFHSLPDALRRTLREYAIERKEVLRVKQRERVYSDLSEALKEKVAWTVNGDWLRRIPVMQRLPQKFLVQVALKMSPAVYAPKEKPPAQRLYVITTGICSYGGRTLKQGEHWRALTKTKGATAITYLHVMYVATQTIDELAATDGDATILWAIRKWTLWHKLREHAFEQAKLARRRKAWRERYGDNEPFPEDGDDFREELEETKLFARVNDGECYFWFMSRSELLGSEESTLPSFQELRTRDWLTEKVISRKESYKGTYSDEYLAVSHRWFDPHAPDKDGRQLKEVRNHVRENDGIKWVWFGEQPRSP